MYWRTLSAEFGSIRYRDITNPGPKRHHFMARQDFNKRNEDDFWLIRTGPRRFVAYSQTKQKIENFCRHYTKTLWHTQEPEEIRKRFWSPDWKKEVKAIMERCSRCQAFKDNNEKKRLLLRPSGVELHTWRRVGHADRSRGQPRETDISLSCRNMRLSPAQSGDYYQWSDGYASPVRVARGNLVRTERTVQKSSFPRRSHGKQDEVPYATVEHHRTTVWNGRAREQDLGVDGPHQARCKKQWDHALVKWYMHITRPYVTRPIFRPSRLCSGAS